MARRLDFTNPNIQWVIDGKIPTAEQIQEFGRIHTALEWVYVTSSNVDALAYDDIEGNMYVRFLNGSEYKYENVAPIIFESIRDGALATEENPNSVGHTLWALVKNVGYKYEKIR